MMLRERWRLVAVLGVGLGLTAGLAPGQSGRHAPKTVQPEQGAPPDQAVQPDVSSQLPAGQQEQFPEPEIAPATPPPPPPAQEPAAAASPAAPQAAAVPAPVVPAPAPPLVPAKTPEGRKLQEETATLLQLAQELKVELDKAGKNTLSLAALRKADAIQKMSKDLKEAMSRQEAAGSH